MITKQFTQEQVQGYLIELPFGYSGGIHKTERGYWQVTELQTGLSVLKEPLKTRAEVIRQARENVLAVGEENMEKCIAWGMKYLKK